MSPHFLTIWRILNKNSAERKQANDQIWRISHQKIPVFSQSRKVLSATDRRHLQQFLQLFRIAKTKI